MGARPPLPLLIAALLALTALGGAADTARAGDGPPVAAGETVLIHMRIWQHVDDSDNIWISARPKGGRWDTLGTIPFPLVHGAGGYSPVSEFRYADLAIAGIGLRVWEHASQLEAQREDLFVQACTASCARPVRGEWLRWRPLGMIPLALDDGRSTSGRYRYGDLTVVVPKDARLLADREHLLALRDVLEGGATELDWSASRAAEDWEGVTVTGTPPRVTGLDLSGRGLTGEIWGYLGDLSELTDLRLDGNSLTGMIPSKLVLLKQLTALRLAGNRFEHCIPPPLHTVPDNDLDSLRLPDCTDPASGWASGPILAAGSYRAVVDFNDIAVFDVPTGKSIQFDEAWSGSICEVDEADAARFSIWDAIGCGWEVGFILRETDRPTSWEAPGTWLVVDGWRSLGDELERSHYTGCVYDCGADSSPAALIEQLMGSVWVNTAPGSDDGEWVWP